MKISRRNFATATATICAPAGLYACNPPHAVNSQLQPAKDFRGPQAGTGSQASLGLKDLEARIGGRIGVFAFSSQGQSPLIQHRADERFAMCSTFKWALAAAILKTADEGQLSMEERVSYTESDLLEYAPVTRAHLAQGWLTVSELAEASVKVSDNTAANLLLAKIGGPAGLTRFFRQAGDDFTRLDRTEPALNTNLPGDERDTTTPRAMAKLMAGVLEKDLLSAEGRALLVDWLVASETGLNRLRGGFPAGLRAGDKTGTGNRGAVNDVAVLWTTPSTPVFVASYMSGSEASLERLNGAHLEIGKRVAKLLGSD